MAETYVTLSSLRHYDEKIKEVIGEKQDQLVGIEGQVVSFDADGNVISKDLEKIEIDTSDFVIKEEGKGLFSGSYNDLTDKPEIPSVEGLASEDYVDTKFDTIMGEGASTTLDTIGEISKAIEDNEDVVEALNSAIGNKVDKVDGKGLSANDLTDTLKSNYDTAYSHSQSSHAPSTAEENVIVGIQRNGTDLSVDSSTRKVNVTVPTKTSELTNDSGFKTTDNNTTYELSKSGSTITLTGSDGSTTSVSDSNTTYSVATSSANGLMSSTDKAKLDTITESADAVSFTQSLTSGTKVGTININGTNTALYAPTNTDTHYTSKNVVGSTSATSNTTTALTNGNVYLNSVENGSVTSTHKISGSGATTVTTDTSGNIVITSTDNNTVTTATTTGSGNAVTAITASNGALTVTKGSTFLTAHPTISTSTDTTSTATATHGGTVTMVDSVTRDGNGHVTKINTKTVTLPSDADTKYTHPTTSGNKHIPSGGSSGQILRWSADGTAVWGADNNTTYGVVSTTADGLAPKRDGSTTKYLRADGTWATPPDNNTTYNNMTAATSSAAGKAGLVPAPAAGAQAKFLRGDGTWQTPTNTTYSNFVKSGSGAKAGLVPAPSTTAGTTKYLREDGTWTTPPDTNTTYSTATQSAQGLMSASDKTKLDGIATGANKTTVDSALSSTSTNPVQNKVINSALSGKASTSVATSSANGLMSSTDKAKLDAITASADAVSVTQKLTSGTEIGTVTINGTDTKLYAPTNTDTKNTAGSTDSSSKLFLVGATSQAANPQTYSHDTAYIGADGHLYSNGLQTVNLSGSQALTNKTYNGYTLAAACAKAVTDSSSAGAISTGTGLVTERDVYYGLPTINNSHAYTSSTSIYAPVSGGTSGYILKANGSKSTPTWSSVNSLQLFQYKKVTIGIGASGTVLSYSNAPSYTGQLRLVTIYNGADTVGFSIWIFANKIYIPNSTTSYTSITATQIGNIIGNSGVAQSLTLALSSGSYVLTLTNNDKNSATSCYVYTFYQG